ncbi:MAG: hypothetical protein KME54_16005 [Tolypothrix brevis GSE-NOS-MK-07-07A]|jgi:hypothetical protein|nr:hypothetical protein [Tolypothrix brevis GSE-NOS-MK-07-07A]
MNIKLVESLLEVILALPPEERLLLEEKLFGNISYPSSNEIMHVAEKGKVFDFLHDEPELYSFQDAEPV